MKVVACPECGVPVAHHCFHDGEEVYSEEMDVDEAVALAEFAVSGLQEDLNGMLGVLEDLRGRAQRQ